MRLETLAAAGPAGIGLALPTKPYMRIATALHIPVNTYVHRGLAQVWDGKCELVSRRRSSYERFWDLHGSLAKLKVKDRSSTAKLSAWTRKAEIFAMSYFSVGLSNFLWFDLLYLNGRDLRQLPLIERKEKLRALIEKSALPDVNGVLRRTRRLKIQGLALLFRLAPASGWTNKPFVKSS